MRRWMVAMMVLTVLAAALPGSVAGAGKSIQAKTCKQLYATLGYATPGRCVKVIVRSPAEPASLELVEATSTGGVFPCPAIGGCLLGVRGDGLRPGSDVTVADTQAAYSAVLSADAAGEIAIDGIFELGGCTADTAPRTFTAQGTAANGGGVTSAPIVIDLLAYLPACP